MKLSRPRCVSVNTANLRSRLTCATSAEEFRHTNTQTLLLNRDAQTQLGINRVTQIHSVSLSRIGLDPSWFPVPVSLSSGPHHHRTTFQWRRRPLQGQADRRGPRNQR